MRRTFLIALLAAISYIVMLAPGAMAGPSPYTISVAGLGDVNGNCRFEVLTEYKGGSVIGGNTYAQLFSGSSQVGNASAGGIAKTAGVVQSYVYVDVAPSLLTTGSDYFFHVYQVNKRLVTAGSYANTSVFTITSGTCPSGPISAYPV